MMPLLGWDGLGYRAKNGGCSLEDCDFQWGPLLGGRICCLTKDDAN